MRSRIREGVIHTQQGFLRLAQYPSCMRVWFSRLAMEDARRAATRWALVASIVGAAISIAVLAGIGRLDRWLFAILVWGALIFVPLWLAITAAQGLAPRTRATLAARAAADPARYDRSAPLRLTVERLAEGAVVMPRICSPLNRRQAIEAAIAIITKARSHHRAASVLTAPMRQALVAATDEAMALSAAATGAAADNIQARWSSARALGALAAVITVLAEAYADQSGTPLRPVELGEREMSDYLAALLDYADEAAMDIDAQPWTEPALIDANGASPPVIAAREAWHAYIKAGLPAPRALAAFVDALGEITVA
jgi:hypothetical protein